jgi:hypothetical protein
LHASRVEMFSVYVWTLLLLHREFVGQAVSSWAACCQSGHWPPACIVTSQGRNHPAAATAGFSSRRISLISADAVYVSAAYKSLTQYFTHSFFFFFFFLYIILINFLTYASGWMVMSFIHQVIEEPTFFFFLHYYYIFLSRI